MRTIANLLVLSLAAVTATAGEPALPQERLRLTLKLGAESILPLEPVKATVCLENRSGEELAKLPAIKPSGEGVGVQFYVQAAKAPRHLRKSVPSFEEDERGGGVRSFPLPPGKEACTEVLLTLDWSDRKPAFPEPGKYEVWATYAAPDLGTVESGRVALVVREPRTEAEKAALGELKAEDVATAVYFPLGLLDDFLVKDPRKTVARVRELYLLKPATPYTLYAREALAQWQADERRYRKGGYAEAQRRGLDKLGLQDLDLGAGAGGETPTPAPTPGGDQPPAKVSDEERKAVEALLGRFAAAWSARDLEACMKLLSPDAKGFGGGTDAIRRSLQEDFGKEKGLTLSMKQEFLDFRSGPAGEVVVRVSSRVEVQGKPPTSPHQLRYTLARNQKTGAWEIAAIGPDTNY